MSGARPGAAAAGSAGAAPAEATLAALLREALARLAARQPGARLDAEVLLAHATGRSRAQLYAWPAEAVSAAAARRFRELVRRRAAGEPVAHLTGRREFWSLALRVSTHTLIPRPETERLVEAALALPGPAPARRVADLGTGCGAIALALARERPGWHLIATDLSAAALAVAADNARRLGACNVEFRRGDWCRPLRGERLDLIVCNPPYVRDGDAALARGDVRFEPRLALLGGRDGLDALRRVAGAAPRVLAPGGWLLLEHGPAQGGAVRALLRRLGYGQVATLRDLAGRERVTRGVRPA